MMILLDPLVAVPPEHPSSTLTSDPVFWDRILEWSSDERVYVGQESHSLIYEEYARYGYPEQNLNLSGSPLKREYQAALNILLARIARHTRESNEITFSREYLGAPEYQLAFQIDVSGTAGANLCAVATDASHWAEVGDEAVVIDPPPPAALEVCFHGGIQLQKEKEEAIHSFFHEKRIYIVGGQVDQILTSRLYSHLGIGAGAISWLPCEKAKPPRDLDKRWKHLDSTRDMTVCITGRVGHATSGLAEQSASRAGVVHLQVESASGIEQALLNHAALHG